MRRRMPCAESRPQPRGRKIAGLLISLAWMLACEPNHVIDPKATTSDGLVFVRDDQGYGDLWRVRLSDGAERVLLRSEGTDERWPFWSSGARKVLFEARPQGATRPRLFLIDPRLRQATALSQEKNDREHWAVWSSDGTRVAYAFADRLHPNGPQGIAEVLVGTSRRRNVSPAKWHTRLLRPEYHPSNGSILAQQHVNKRTSALWLFEVDEPPRQLFQAPGTLVGKARFTHDGQAIHFSSQVGNDRKRDIELIDLNRNQRRVLAGDPEFDEHSSRESPTQRELAFISDRDGSWDLFIVPMDGGPTRNLSQTPDRDEAAPRWSPDGKKIAVSTRERNPERPNLAKGYTHIAVFDRRTGEKLLETEGVMPDWMPPW
ncbi:hypothetical protein MK489_21055 [Myxococcota bacterium]|nr:hypothetical protein [Myxococcota bacterium]